MTEAIRWTNETRRLDELQPWPRNPRQINKDQAKRLAQSFDEFGQVETIAIGPGNEVYNGHQRLSVLMDKHGGAYEVEVRVSSRPLSEKEREKLTVFLHKGAAGAWDWDTLANEFEFDELVEWGFDEKELLGAGFEQDEPEGEDPGAQVDKAEELRQKWGVETGQLWKLGEHRLICGDCTDRAVVERVMGGEKAGAVFIDPPYMTFGSSTGKLESGDFAMLAPFWDIVAKTAQENLEDGRAAFICCDWRSYPTLFNAAFKHMTVKNLIVWDMGGALKLGTGNFRPSYELLVYAINSKFGRTWVDHQKGAWKIEDRAARDLWTIKQGEAAPGKNREHASQKPVELADRAIQYTSKDGDIIFDYFAGSGTVLIACERISRKCRAVEISPAYCAVAIQRWVDMTGGTPELIEEN